MRASLLAPWKTKMHSGHRPDSKGIHVTETTTITPDAGVGSSTAEAASTPRPKSGGGLNGKVLAELQQVAGGLGIKGTAKMRKSVLIEAIQAAQNGTARAEATPVTEKTAPNGRSQEARADNTSETVDADDHGNQHSGGRGNDNRSRNDGGGNNNRENNNRGNRNNNDGAGRNNDNNRNNNNDGNRNRNNNDGNDNRDNDNRGNRGNRNDGGGGNRSRNNDGGNNRGDDDDFEGGRNRNRNRSRNRNRNSNRDNNNRNRGPEGEPVISDDDVLIPAAGILDIKDNYAFVRTSGYLPGSNDVYVSLAMVRKWGLRKGDAVIGQVRQALEGERKEKFNPMVKIDSINGMTIEESKNRVSFADLTPLYPAERLRLETESHILTTRIIDIVSPIGKGQRGLIVSPPKAGKTMVLQAIANAITTNNPECHLMVVLVDERPEEVTDMQRTVKGEVIASTFDRPAEDHTTVAELAIERAKRLVELGADVIVLLDSITRLGRAYNLAAPASGRIMSGGVDSSALYPPKKFFGAARNIEDGGSLTILATALVDTGSRMDEVIFEEFKGTGNAELKLDRRFADKRIFPAIDVLASGTRREELLMAKDELAVVWQLRRVLSGLEGQQGLELMIEKLKSTKSNIEFLMQINKTMPQATNGRSGDEG